MNKTIEHNGKKYRCEPFESLGEACEYLIAGKEGGYAGVLYNGHVVYCETTVSLCELKDKYLYMKKLIEIEEPKVREFWLWDYKAETGAWIRSEFFLDENMCVPEGDAQDFILNTTKRKVESSRLVLGENGNIVE